MNPNLFSANAVLRKDRLVSAAEFEHPVGPAADSFTEDDSMSRKPIWVSLALLVTAATAGAQQNPPAKAPKVPLNKVPEGAIKAAQDRHPDLDILWAKKEDLNGAPSYRIKLKDPEGDRYVGVSADGKLLYTEQKAKADSLPTAVKASIENEFLGAKVKDVRTKTAADGTVSYRLDTSAGKAKDRAVLDASGTVMSLRNGTAGGVEARLGRFFTGRGFEEKNWETWLASAITSAKFSEEQQSKAKALLAEAKSAVADYRRTREAEYKRIAADLAEVRTNPAAAKDRKAGVEKAATALAAPVEEVGRKWRADVIALLSDEQRKLVPR
jgi:hypothetical protein